MHYKNSHEMVSGTEMISVIIPVYNVERDLARCLNSVINNTYKRLEIICVNDGSTDQSLNILNRYSKIDNRIIIIDQPNRGVSVARNEGMKKASGRFITFVDADDWIHKEYFVRLIDCQNATKCDMVICRYLKTEQHLKQENREIGPYKLLGLEDFFRDCDAKSHVWGRIYSKKILADIKFEADVKLGEDELFNAEVICRNSNFKIVILEEKLYYYFERVESALHVLQPTSAWPLCEKFYELSTISENDTIKQECLIQAVKRALSLRYLVMFSKEKRKVTMQCNSFLKKCNREIGKLRWQHRLLYYMLYRFPFIYRMFRIIDDRSMLDWEKSQKRIKVVTTERRK